jgi:Icc-related predicted phosphoesterase
MAADDLMQIRITADFKEAEDAFLKMAKVATSFESDFRRIAGGLNKEFNKINGMAELFGNSTNVVKDKMDALKKSMEQLMTLGIQPMNPQVQKLKAQYDALAASITHTTQETTKVSKATTDAGNSVKKSNMQWTNWALVLQDLPYGFRGIQNNLPALMGGIAGMAGPLYLVGSAIIALFTAWDQGSFKAEQAIDRVAEAHKKNTEVLTKGAEAEAQAFVEMRKMSTIFNDVKDGTITAKDALKTYNDTYGETWGIAKNVNEAEDSFIKKSSAYVKATALRAMANEKYAQAQEAFKKGRLAQGEDQTTFLQKLASAMDALDQVGIMGFDLTSMTKFTKAFSKNLAGTQNVLVNDIINQAATSLDLLISEGAKLDSEANKILSKVGIKPTGKGKKTTEPKLKQDKSLLESLKAEQSLYKDDMFMKRAIGLQVLNEEERLAIQEATFNKASNEVLLNIANEFKFKRLAIEKETLDAIQAVRNADYDTAAKAKEKADKEAEDAAKKLADRNLQNSLDAINILATAQQKQHKGNQVNILKDLENEKQALYNLADSAEWTAEQWDKIVDAIAKVKGEIQGSQPVLKNFEVTWTDTINAMNGIINDFINNSLYALGESIGKVLAGENVDAIDVFGTLIADALQSLGKQLIAFGVAKLAAWDALKDITPAGAALAIAAGVAAVAAGAALKSSLTHSQTGGGANSNSQNSNNPRKFANGGIISGPTMGLMGEYPGAKTNPEVVAPLDKLKDMIGGGGGGTFMLRGQDLLLSVNRAQKASNLKGQNISLI